MGHPKGRVNTRKLLSLLDRSDLIAIFDSALQCRAWARRVTNVCMVPVSRGSDVLCEIGPNIVFYLYVLRLGLNVSS